MCSFNSLNIECHCCSVAKSCLTLCDPINCSMPGSPVLYYHPEFAQTHAYGVSDAIQSCHPLLPPSPAFNLSKHHVFFFFPPVSRLFTSGGQSIRVSASASVLPVNNQGWFPLRFTAFISLLPKGLSRVFSSTSLKASVLWCSVLIMVQLSRSHMAPGKTIALTIWTFVSKVMSLLFNMLSRFIIAFLPRSQCLLISLLQLPSIVIFEHKKIKSVTISTFSPSICHEVTGPDVKTYIFWMLSFKASL